VQTEQEVRTSSASIASETAEQSQVIGRFRSVVGLLDLLWVLTESDLRFRYGRGPWRFMRWFLEPFALVGVYLILITFVLDRPGKAIGLSLACAVVPFQFVMLTVINAMTALDVRRPIILNMKFKRMLIPPSSAVTESVGFGSSLFLIILMMAVYKVAPTWNLLWFPLLLLVNLLLAVAAAYPAVLFGIWLRELRAFVMSFIRVLFFLSPGLVPLSEARPSARSLLQLNPLTGLFEAYRAVFMFGRSPEAWQLLYPLATVAILLVVFIPVFRAEQRQFAKVI
jgi:lipopolysaccharide transport system permease protein